MTQFRYIEDLLLHSGRDKQCNELPPRESGESGEDWMVHVRDVAASGVKVRKWDRAFEADMVFCAELICTELCRYRSMIDWDQDLYVAAVESKTHPLDRDGMLLLTDPAVFDDEGPLDAETIALLNDLTSDGDGAQA